MSDPSQKAATVAVVILNWNTIDLLRQFLPLVLEQSRQEGVEIVVADNGSTDGSVEMVQHDFPEIKLISLDRNYGFAGGYNRALKKIKAPFSVLLNSDVEPGRDWLTPLIKQMQSNPTIAACVPKIKYLKKRTSFEYAGAAGGFIDRLGYTFCRGRIFNEIEEDRQQYDQSGEIFWGSGAALMVQTPLFNQSGGLDEHFFAHMEEIDWCWRMKNRGLKIWYVSQSEVFHLGGGTLSHLSSRKTFLNFRNNLYLLYHNLPQKGFYKTMLFRLLLDGVAALKFFFSAEWKHAAAIFSAHMAFYKALGRLRNERTVLLKQAVKNNHSEIYSKSIVYAFFFRGIKKFNDLVF